MMRFGHRHGVRETLLALQYMSRMGLRNAERRARRWSSDRASKENSYDAIGSACRRNVNPDVPRNRPSLNRWMQTVYLESAIGINAIADSGERGRESRDAVRPCVLVVPSDLWPIGR